jgi:hypothetical protein
MGRIIGYQYDDNVQDGDAWIGSEDGGGKTKQYTAEAVANYLNIQGKISIVGQMTYKYGITPLSGPGTFAVFGGGTDPVAFSAITKLTLSNTDVSKQRVVEFLNLLVGSDILISKQSAISTFGYYSIDNYAVNATDPAYYDLGVTFKSGNGSMEAEQIYETQNFTLAAEENISTLQTTIDAGNTYQASPSEVLWTWGTSEITATSAFFTSLLSGKRFKTTLIADGSYTDVLPNQITFSNALNNETSITTNTALSSSIELQWPSASGTLALTTDITASPWDTVTGGINYANGNVGIGTTSPSSPLHVETFASGPTARFINTSGTGGMGVWIQGGIGSSSNILILSDYSNNERLRVRGDGNVGIGTTSPSTKLEVAGNILANATNATVNIGSTISSTPTYGYSGTAAGTIIVGGYTNSSYSYQPGVMTLINQNPIIGAGTDLGVIQFAGKDDATSGYVSTMIKAFTAAAAGSGTSGGGIITISTTTTGYGSPIERFRINDSGNVGIGTTTPSHKLDVTGTGRFTSTLTCQTLVQTSQRDQKKDIGDITKTKAISIPFKEYKYKSESGDRKRYGVVAEDIEAHYPELVHTDPNGVKGVNYIDLLVKRVAELEKELEDISLTPGPKGDTGATGATGATGDAGKNGANGNSHLENVTSIKYNEKTKKLEILIDGQKSPFSFTPATTEFEPGDGLSTGLG